MAAVRTSGNVGARLEPRDFGDIECQRSVEYRAPLRFALTGGKFIASDAASFRTAGMRVGHVACSVNSFVGFF